MREDQPTGELKSRSDILKPELDVDDSASVPARHDPHSAPLFASDHAYIIPSITALVLDL